MQAYNAPGTLIPQQLGFQPLGAAAAGAPPPMYMTGQAAYPNQPYGYSGLAQQQFPQQQFPQQQLPPQSYQQNAGQFPMSQPYGAAQYPQASFAAPGYNQAAPMYNQAPPAYGYAQPGDCSQLIIFPNYLAMPARAAVPLQCNVCFQNPRFSPSHNTLYFRRCGPSRTAINQPRLQHEQWADGVGCWCCWRCCSRWVMMPYLLLPECV